MQGDVPAGHLPTATGPESSAQARNDGGPAQSPGPAAWPRLPLLASGSREELARLVDAAGALPVDELRHRLSRALARRPPPPGSDRVVEVLAVEICRRDPEAAGRIFAGLEPEVWQEIEAIALPALARSDPGAAVKLFHDLAAPGEGRAPPVELLAVLVEDDPGLAKRLVEGLDPVSRGEGFAALAAVASADDPGAALDLLGSLSGVDLVSALGSAEALDRLVVHDPGAVAGLVGRAPVSSTSARVFARLGRSWAKEDPAAALEWAGAVQFEALRAGAMAAVFGSWAEDDHDAAIDALADLGDGPLRRQLVGEVAETVFGGALRGDPVAAERWARSLDGSDRSLALAVLGARVAADDPAAAVAHLEEAIALGGGDHGAASVEIAAALTGRDPAAAGTWAAGLEDETARAAAVAGVADAWSSSQPVAASEWIATLPDGPARNNAIGKLVDNIRSADPSSAFEWAADVTGDPERRLYFLKRATDAWTVSSPDATRAAIEDLEISEADRRTLLIRLRTH